jgi:hypothetical protein
MRKSLTPRELIAVARCLTRFQSDITDYELKQFAALGPAQRKQIEQALGLLAATAARLYAYSVRLEFNRVLPEIKKMQLAAEKLKIFLDSVQKIQRVLDAVTAVAALADAIMSHDAEAVTSGIDNMIGIISKD